MYVNPCTWIRGQAISRQVFRLQLPKIKINIYLGISTLGEMAEFPVTQSEINDQLILKRLGKKSFGFSKGSQDGRKKWERLMFPLSYGPQTSVWESSCILDVHISEFTFQGRHVRGMHSDSSNSMLFSLHYILNYLLTPIPRVVPAPYHTDSKFPV